MGKGKESGIWNPLGNICDPVCIDGKDIMLGPENEDDEGMDVDMDAAVVEDKGLCLRGC